MANVIHVETDSDDGELWVPEGAETSPPELAPLNPWRSSTMLRTHREVGLLAKCKRTFTCICRGACTTHIRY